MIALHSERALGDTHNSTTATDNGRYGSGGSTSGRYDLVFRNRDMYYQEILYESGRYRWGVGGSKNNVSVAVVELWVSPNSKEQIPFSLQYH